MPCLAGLIIKTERCGNMKKILKAENFMCLFLLCVLPFIYNRLYVFFEDAWGVNEIGKLIIAALFAVFVIFAAFREKIYSFIENNAYGFSSKTGLIYFLAVITMIKYRHIFSDPFGSGILPAVGSGFVLGFFVLMCMKGAEKIIAALSRIKITKSDIFFIIFVYAALNVEIFLYCKYMKHIFIWDNAGYFLMADRLNNSFPSFSYFKEVFYSVTREDYNYVILFFASIFRKLFGSSRYVFLLSVVNCFLAPFFIALHFIGKRFFSSNVFHSVCALLAIPYLISASNLGFIDVGGVIVVFFAMILFLYSDDLGVALLSGVLAAFAVLLRRWYSFFAVSFVITCFLYELPRKKCAKSIAACCGFAFVLLFFFQKFVTGRLMADYKDMYSAYAFGIKADYFLFVRYYGIIFTAALVIYALVKQIKSEKKYIMTKEMFFLVQALLCFFIFTYVQTHGQQHLALYAPSLAALFMMFCADVVKNKKLPCVVLLIFSLLQTGNTFIRRAEPGSVSEIKSHALLPNFSSYPPTDMNADEIININNYLDSNIGEKGKTVCVLASSLKLNWETFMNAEISLSVKQKSGIRRSDYFLQLSDVDKRDGLSDNLFYADYILVPSELQTHLSPSEQKVIAVPYEMIVNKEGFGENYEKTGTVFSLPDGTQIYLYEKINDLTPQQHEEILQKIFG